MAGLEFELGSPEKARGHALIYFNNNQNPGKVVASYVIVPPIGFDLSKYVPPMLASRMPQMGSESILFVPLPPVPEPFESYESLKALAELRGDDLIRGGNVDPSQIDSALMAVNQAAQEYANLYQQNLSGATSSASESDLAVNEILYSLMGEKDKLSELAKLTGKLRYAVDGSDRVLAAETVHEMEILARLLPEKYRLRDLIRVAQRTDDKGSRLAELYLSRCYKISNEEYADLEQIDRSIRQLDQES